MSFCRRTLMCSVATLALLGLPTPATALIHFVRGYHCLGRLAASSRERKATRIGVAAEAATGPTEGLTDSGFCEGLTRLNFEEMEAWLDEAGVDRRSGTGGAPTGRLKCFAGRGIGLEATVKLERDSTVASIPRHVCLSSNDVDAPSGTLRSWAHTILASITPSPTAVGPKLPGKPIALERDVAVVTLQLFLERLAGPRSTFAPWMTLLGREGSLNLPALWPAKDIEALKGTLVLQEVETCLKRAELERNLVEAAVADGLRRKVANAGRFSTDAFPELACLDSGGLKGRPTQAEWLHARCTIQSRAYRVGPRYLLVPLVDFANHDDDVAFAVCSGDGVFTGADEIVFVSDRNYLPGQEVCTTYGDMDNAKRLFSFGFVTLSQHGQRSSCFSDRLSLPTESFCDVLFPVVSTDPLLDFKESVIQECGREAEDGLSLLSAVFPLTPSHPLVSQLVDGPARSFVESAMPMLRLAALTTEEFRSEALGDLCLWRKGAAAEEDRENGTERRPRIVGTAAHVQSSGQACTFPAAVLPGRGDEVLARLRARVSLDNDREALRLLSDQCYARLKGIDLCCNDVEALREASAGTGEGNGCDSFAASEPRRLLCAAVRVGEASAWHALLDACARVRGVAVPAEEQTWASWVCEQCRSKR